MVLGVLEHLRVDLLGVVGLGAKLSPKVRALAQNRVWSQNLSTFFKLILVRYYIFQLKFITIFLVIIYSTF